MKGIDSRVRKILEELIFNNGEIGLQVAAYLGDKLVIDTWAGLADESSRQPVDGPFRNFSRMKYVSLWV